MLGRGGLFTGSARIEQYGWVLYVSTMCACRARSACMLGVNAVIVYATHDELYVTVESGMGTHQIINLCNPYFNFAWLNYFVVFYFAKALCETIVATAFH